MAATKDKSMTLFLIELQAIRRPSGWHPFKATFVRPDLEVLRLKHPFHEVRVRVFEEVSK